MLSRFSQLAPSKWSYSQWRKFFIIAAIWNIFFAAPASFWPEFNMKIFYDVLYGEDYAIILNRCFWIFILALGVGFGVVSKGPEKNHGVLVIGVIVKIALAITWFGLVLDRMATFVALFCALGEALFVIYFVYYLISGPTHEETEVPI
ncbi:hypothetical protein [Desulfatibacillum aliphaticivorans]|uniref:hypothetical protein n=1 Tax=Desulfatibacillum aliphaticivorans TaxID=218208 RepID=UPI00041DBEF8|nr:hypothetical protein [Desulfatibacillum aliphaticivorans]